MANPTETASEKIEGHSIIENARGDLLGIHDPMRRLQVIEDLTRMLEFLVSETCAFEMPQASELEER